MEEWREHLAELKEYYAKVGFRLGPPRVSLRVPPLQDPEKQDPPASYSSMSQLLPSSMPPQMVCKSLGAIWCVSGPGHTGQRWDTLFG